MTRLLTRKNTAELIGYTEIHLSRLAKAGKFPKPVKMGDAKNSRVGFLETEVETWLTERMAQRQAPAAA